MKAWKKYGVKYQHTPEEHPVLSALSTLPKLYPPLNDLKEDDQRLHYLYTHIPHHKEQLSLEGYNALQKTRSWVNILPLPTSLKNVFTNEPKEDNSNSMNLVVSSSATHIDKGKSKVSGHSRRKDNNTADDPDPSKSSNTIWMGMDTPFKGANKWFVDNTRSNRSCQPGTSRVQGEDTNILLGIATPLPPRTTTMMFKDWGDQDPLPHKPDPREMIIVPSVQSGTSRNKEQRT